MLQDRNLSPGTWILPGNGAQQLNQSRSEPKKITWEELMVRTLAITDALAKLTITKGIITDEEFKT